jgi:signal transduction histidine kinase/ActR/RegA family two-component response regulator
MESAGVQAEPTRATILIVDDRPANLLTLSEMLDDLNENIIQARSGADALRCLLRQPVAIVLLDVQMPDMDGYELAALMRERERTRHTPIIFMTAYDKDYQDISRGYALGAVDYVFRPIDPVVLKAKVSVFVDLFKKTEAVREQAKLEHRLQLENLRVRTEKMEAERALRQIEERQSLIIKSLPIALYTADLKGGFAGPRFLSDSMASTVGFGPTAFVEDVDLWPARIHPTDLPHVLAQLATIGERGALSTEYRWRCADGSERMFLDQAVLVRDEAGVAREMLGTCLDVTYRKQLEHQLVQSQKMEALGQLTGGIAHDFNNMLSVIIWNLDVLTRTLGRGGKDGERAQNTLSAALNCAELVRQLLTFARREPHQARTIELPTLVSTMVKLLGPIVGESITLSTVLAPEVWPIFADQAQIESALLNLAINSRDAMPDGGMLTVECRNVEHEMGGFDHSPGDYIMLAVSDTGIGMAPDVVERAFEPFFTTKESGRGSGLGLSMVYGFVRQSGGHVKLESVIGAGTTVRLYLPRAARAQSGEARAMAESETGAAIERRVILVVEDNASVRQVTVARLEYLGHRVLAAVGTSEALAILESDAAIDLLFTDVVMPGGMSGFDLARRAFELRPSLKALFTSGYASSYTTTGGVMGELLQKPYRDEDLQRALQRVFAPGSVPRLAAAGD